MLSLSFYPTEALKSLRSLRLINHPAGVRICANEQNCIQYDRRKSRNRIIHGSDFSHMFDLLLNLSSWDMLIINSCSLDFYGISAKCNFLGKNGVIEAKIVEIVIYGKIVLKYIAACYADLGRILFTSFMFSTFPRFVLPCPMSHLQKSESHAVLGREIWFALKSTSYIIQVIQGRRKVLRPCSVKLNISYILFQN